MARVGGGVEVQGHVGRHLAGVVQLFVATYRADAIKASETNIYQVVEASWDKRLLDLILSTCAYQLHELLICLRFRNFRRICCTVERLVYLRVS